MSNHRPQSILQALFRAAVRAGVLAVVVLPAAVSACPDCPAAQAVRASFFDQRFWGYLAVLLVPLLISCALAGLAYRVGQPRAARARGTDR
jgi:hypothetical protein